jgi:hypothetical protein
MKTKGYRGSNLGRWFYDGWWGYTGRRRGQAVVAAPWEGGELWLNQPRVNQIPCSLILRDRNKMVILFCIPSSGGGRCRARAAAASIARTWSMVWGLFGAPPAWPRPWTTSSRPPLASPGNELAWAAADSCTWKILWLGELWLILDEIRATLGTI